MSNYTTPAERLEQREDFYCEDESLALMIKSGDIEGLKWSFQKGWPMNYKGADFLLIVVDVSLV